jgi:ankyrin repeat protein
LNLTSETLGNQIVAELEHTATSNPDPKLMANACFSLCLVFGSGRILTPMLRNEALNWLAKSAILGSKAAFLVGRRIFEANECPIPETIENNFDQDLPTETSVHKQSTESQFFAEAIRILLPQKLQSDLRHRFRMAGVTDTAGQMFSWTKEKCDHFQSNDEFIQFANEHLLLHVSIAFQDLETTTFLLGTGCSVNLEGPEGLTPLLVACQCGNKTFVDALLERGADASRASHNGVTPLHWLILFPSEVMEALVKALTDHEANVNHLMNDFNYVFVDGLGLALEGSPLCWSVLCRNHAAIAALLHWGAGPSVQHCLRHALQLVCADVLEQLISENGVLKVTEDRPSDLWYQIGAEARREFHRWCIHGKAYTSAYAATMDVLVRHGMQYPGIPAEYKDSPLSRAVMNCNIPLARELIKRGADINETDPTNGATLLTNLIISDVVEISDIFKKVQMVELLLESGVPTQPPARGMKDPGWSPGFYQTPLSLACSFQATLPVIELLASHCPRHVSDKYGGKTALLSLPGSHSDMEAAEIARLLLSLGADPEIEGDHSAYNTGGNWVCCRRAVDIAVQHKNLKLLEIYLGHGVSPVMGVTGGHSFTVLHTAVFEALCHMQQRSGSQGESRAASFIDCILSYPIPRDNGWIEIADHKGYTPLWYAIYWGLPATVEVLLSHDAVKLSLKNEATVTDVLHFSYEHPPLFVKTGADGDSEAIFYISRYMLPESPAAYTKRLDKIAELLRAEVRL